MCALGLAQNLAFVSRPTYTFSMKSTEGFIHKALDLNPTELLREDFQVGHTFRKLYNITVKKIAWCPAVTQNTGR